jgi:hypothetical protein
MGDDKTTREDKLLSAVVQLLKSHSELTSKEYKRDTTYNSDSIGYKEEENVMEALQEFTGLGIMYILRKYGHE